MSELDFDMQAAWLRRFSADAQSNLGAFARRLKEAMPELVSIQEKKGFFAKTGTITGVTIELGENRYRLELAGGRLQASIGMVVRGITLNTKTMDPAEWFARLAQETANASAHAQSLSASLQQFMAS
ncbi:hypothetical protein GCM10010909_21790 [Acidocella aquatica]|uniref:Uncharacterized protein n=1 Tax=Acidocella aquatica TaxID=1922313 RepID=A0ABQ6A860_9PROT|nr:hypothetical protein [Acidocella aquatica]GLR67498.1 hypothetical protein GCM10010909_21790 [Acidocella aquatica]